MLTTATFRANTHNLVFHSFRDDKHRSNYRLVVRGKTGERDAIIRSVAAKTNQISGGARAAILDAGRITDRYSHRSLTSALREANIERNSFGEKYSVYSLQHFYAVNALRNGIGVFGVARNMGTSVQMIQEYYGKQATSAVFATRLGD